MDCEIDTSEGPESQKGQAGALISLRGKAGLGEIGLKDVEKHKMDTREWIY